MTICTLFDINYAPQGLALLRSVYRHEGQDARVVVLAMCDESAELVRSLYKPIVWTAAMLPQAYHAKAKNRTRAEQCWMATPFLCREVLKAYGSCEYLDADCYLFAPLAECRREIGDAPIGIVHHRWDACHARRLAVNGEYNVGYVYWRESPDACESLQDWCEWCLMFPETERFNDQLFLNHWPERYNAHVISHKGMGLAPYSQLQYDIRERETGIKVDGQPLIEYHFHEWKIGDDGNPHRGGYRLQWEVGKYIYGRYEQEIGATLGVIQ